MNTSMKNISNVICYTCTAIVGGISISDVENVLSILLTLVCIVTAIVNTVISIRRNPSKDNIKKETQELLDNVNEILDNKDKK